MMTRKDFEKLAADLKARIGKMPASKAVAAVNEAVAVCEASNPRFDRERFFLACNVEQIAGWLTAAPQGIALMPAESIYPEPRKRARTVKVGGAKCTCTTCRNRDLRMSACRPAF